MKISKKFYRRNSAQKKRGTVTETLYISGDCSESNLFEYFISNAAKLGYIIRENGAYIAIEYNNIYIVRVYRRNDHKGTFKIRYFKNEFSSNPLLNKATLSGGKLLNIINNLSDLKILLNMLAKKNKL